jgi:hypothetical protein
MDTNNQQISPRIPQRYISGRPDKDRSVRNIEQGEARHRKYKKLKLGGGQAYDRSSD